MTPRRRFLLGSAAAAGALTVGWSLMPPRQRLISGAPVPVAAGQVALNGWVSIGADNTVTVIMAKSEMGQGVHTGLAMLLAEELDADWATVRVQGSPVDRIYANIATAVDAAAFHPDDDSAARKATEWFTAKLVREVGLMLTGGSSSIKDLWLPMRQAGASARAMLVVAAAQRWQVPVAECTVAAGKVSHSGGRSATFGELAADAGKQSLPSKVALKEPAQFKLIGKPLPRLEAAAKGDGSAGFGIDVVQPGMLYASVRMCPTLGGSLARVDRVAALKLPGVQHTVALASGAEVAEMAGLTGGVAVVADTPWHAISAARQLVLEWVEGPNAKLSSAQLMQQFVAALAGTPGFIYHQQGDTDKALAGAAKRISADYQAPYLAHAALEPINCTVLFKDGRAQVWAPTQVPDVARGVAAKVLGLKDEQVDIHVTYLGGGFGRRLDVDFVAQAAAIAKAVPGLPVQTFWSREEDTRHDFYRPASASRFEAGLDAGGRLVAWFNHCASQYLVPAVMARYSVGMPAMPLVAQGQRVLAETLSPLIRLPGVGPDKTTLEGAFDQAYEVPNRRIGHTAVDAGVPVGFWRAVGHSHQAFFKECFIDEVAAAAGQDAVAYRAALLAQHPRHLAVLQRAAALSGWGQALAPAADGAKKARGVALHECFGSIVAQVAEVSVAADKKTIRVHRVVSVIDCGTPINPNLIAQQCEGGVIFGLSAALYGDITVENGQVQQSNFHDYPSLRMDASPQVETHIMPSSAHPQGVGEPAMAPTAPAVANALFALTGQRLRSLPLKLS